MGTTGEGASPRRLRAVAPGAVDREAVQRAVAACAAAEPGGVAVRDLRRAVAGRLALPAGALRDDHLTAAVGLLIATGRLDERGGRLVAVPQERRRAG